MLNNSYTSFHPATSISLRSVWDFLVKGQGPLSSVGVDAMGFIHSDLPNDSDPAWPDIQLMFMSSWMLADYWTLIWRTFGLDGDTMWSGYYRHLYNISSIHAVTILPIILSPSPRAYLSSAPSPPRLPPRLPCPLRTIVAALQPRCYLMWHGVYRGPSRARRSWRHGRSAGRSSARKRVA